MIADPAARATPEFWIEPTAARSMFNIASATLFAGLMIATVVALLAPGALQTTLVALNVPSLVPGLITQSSLANVKVLEAIGHADIGIGLSGLRQVSLVLGAMYLPVVLALLWYRRRSTRIPKSMTRPRAALLAALGLGLGAYVMLSFDVFLVGDGSAPAIVPLHGALAVFGLGFFGAIWSLPICILPFLIR